MKGKDGLSDGCVELHHHPGWQLEFPQLSREELHLLGVLDEGADGLYCLLDIYLTLNINPH